MTAKDMDGIIKTFFHAERLDKPPIDYNGFMLNNTYTVAKNSSHTEDKMQFLHIHLRFL